jgi:hypothetical protein
MPSVPHPSPPNYTVNFTDLYASSSPTSPPWHRLGPMPLESYVNSQFLVTAATNMSSIVIASFVTRCEEYVTYFISREYRTTARDAIESMCCVGITKSTDITEIHDGLDTGTT